VESVKTEVPPEQQSRFCRIEAFYDSEEFYGITIRRTYKVGNTEIKSVTANREDKLVKGDKVVLYIHPDDFMEFERGE
jgi:iron(III) transport system ATP-binding protein